MFCFSSPSRSRGKLIDAITPMRMRTMIISMRLKPFRPMEPPCSTAASTGSMPTSKLRNGNKLLFRQSSLTPAECCTYAESCMPLDKPVPVDLVKQSPQTHPQPLCGGAPIAVGCFQGIDDGNALRCFSRFPERTAPRSLLSGLRGLGRGVWFVSKIGRLQSLLVREHRRALDRVLELSHVAGPLLLLKPCDSGVAECERAAQPLGQPCGEVPGQGRDVVFPLAQRRQLDRHDIDAVEQVLTKPSGADFCFEIARRGGENARVHAARLLIADPADLTLLQHAQQLRLQTERQFADFVQEDRTAIGRLE